MQSLPWYVTTIIGAICAAAAGSVAAAPPWLQPFLIAIAGAGGLGLGFTHSGAVTMTPASATKARRTSK